MNKKIFQILCILIAFSLPLFGKVLPPLIALLFLNWLIEGKFRIKYQRLRQNWYLLLLSPVLFYFLHILGLLYSKNQSFGFFDLEVKLSLLVFPLIIASSEKSMFNKMLLDRIFLFFIAGCITTIFLFSIRAEINFLREHDFQYLYYIYLGWYFHPSYLSMYFVFGLIILYDYLIRDYRNLNIIKKSILVLLILGFQYFIFMLSSKAGIISMFLILPFFILFWMLKEKKIFLGLSMMILLFGFFLILDKAFPLALERMEEAGEAAALNAVPADADGSSAARLNTWKTAFDVISENPIFGVGTGDVKDELMRRYKDNGNTYAYTRQLNAHSQYLQALVVLGIPGFIVLLCMVFIPGCLALKRKEIVITSFIFLIAFNMLVESILETQAGVIFYAFFITLFLRYLTIDREKA